MKKQLKELLNELDNVYQISDNKKYSEKNNKKWGYELIQTPLISNEPIIIGFNWGVNNDWDEYKSGKEYRNQEIIKPRNMLIPHKGSMQRAINSIKDYFPQIALENGSYSNFCFFRSEKANQITEKDISLCIPIFEEMISIINPSIVFCFSSKARDYMKQKHMMKSFKTKKIGKNNSIGNAYITAKGILNNGANIYFLPHPNYKLSKELRKKAWQFCCDPIENYA